MPTETAIRSRSLERPMALRLAGLLAAMAILYFLAYGFFGVGASDHAVIQALAYRIYRGQRLYLDFLHIRPPLSPWLHSLAYMVFPENWQLLAERCWFFLLMAASVWFATVSLNLYFDFRKIGIAPELFGLMAFVLSVHNYPPMPVDTVDAIFFSSAGLFTLAVGDRLRYQALGLWLLFAAALCRQSFYLMPVAGWAFMAAQLRGKALVRASLAGLMPLLTGITLAVLLAPEAFQAFVEQTAGNTRLRDLADLGVQPYVRPAMFIFLPLVIVWRINVLYAWRNFPALIYWLIFFFLLGIHVVKGWTKEVHVPPSFGFSQGFFVLALAVAIKGIWLQPRGNLLVIGLLGVSWFSGLSWEYPTPMLFFAPILFGLVYSLYEEMNFRAPQFFYGMICILLIWAYALLNQFPSDEVYLEDMKYQAGDLYPRLEGVRTGKPNYDQLSEYKHLRSKYGDRLHVLPEFPQAHVLHNTLNPLPLDAELRVIRWRPLMKARMEAALTTSVSYVFLQAHPGMDTTYYDYPWSQYIYENWPRVERGEFFSVYKNPVSDTLSVAKDP